MNRSRVASLVFVSALVFAPLPAAAQGGPPPAPGPGRSLQGQVDALSAAVTALQTALANEASSRAAAEAALDARVAKFEGNIMAADLEGTYNFYMAATAIDDSPTNTLTSYVVTGTMTFGVGGTGQWQGTVGAGTQLTERLPGQNWLAGDVGGSGLFDGFFSWVYANGVVTIDGGAWAGINDFTPTAGGQVIVGVQGGSPGNNQIIFVLTRQPSI
jgi:hypothetical protein